jgi:hypothetical protein
MVVRLKGKKIPDADAPGEYASPDGDGREDE